MSSDYNNIVYIYRLKCNFKICDMNIRASAVNTKFNPGISMMSLYISKYV